MSFIMPDVNNMTLVKNNGYIIVKTTCWLTKKPTNSRTRS